MTRSKIAAILSLAFVVIFCFAGVTATCTVKDVTVSAQMGMPKLLFSLSSAPLLLIPLACSLFGISNDIAMQVVGVGFIIGVIQDSCETAINSSGDVIFAATAEFFHRKKRGEEFTMTPKKL